MAQQAGAREERTAQAGGVPHFFMAPPTPTTTSLAAGQPQPQPSDPDPLRCPRKRQGHQRRTDLEAPLAPLFAPLWAFEVEGAQLRRVLGHCQGPGPCQGRGFIHDGTGQDGDGGIEVGCVEDRRRQQASGLVAATARVDLLRVPEAHRRYISRVFWIPHACRDLGWLAYSPQLRAALERARASVARLAAAAAAAAAEAETAEGPLPPPPPPPPPRFVVKMSAFPKALEVAAGELLLEGRCLDASELSPSASQASHVLHICHCPGWSPLFYYGLTRSVRLEEWLGGARGQQQLQQLPPPPPLSSPSADQGDPGHSESGESGDNGDNGCRGGGSVRIGPAVENTAYRLASSRDKAAKERAKALVRVLDRRGRPVHRQVQEQEDGDGAGDGVSQSQPPLPPVSRAYFKMKEIMEDGHLNPPLLPSSASSFWAGAAALDVGAAPGGWTQYLSERGRVPGLARVVAVDGGILHPRILARPTVRYVGCRVEEPAAARAMAAEGPFRFVASDVNLVPDEMAALIADHVLPHLLPAAAVAAAAAAAAAAPGAAATAGGDDDDDERRAILALTLKFPRKPTPERERATVARVVGILERGAAKVGEGGCLRLRLRLRLAAHRCVWLHANSANERTLLAAVVAVAVADGKGVGAQ